jgi:prephenate dehydrogenase
MGCWYTAQFERHGHVVHWGDGRKEPLSKQWVRQCQVIMLSVPIHTVESVMQKLGPLMEPDQLLVDNCSLKAGALVFYAQILTGSVIGNHPLFGPSVMSFEDQVVFTCNQHGGKWTGWLDGFMEEQGAKLVEIDPVEHDKLMAQIQTLRHLTLLIMGGVLKDMGFDINTSSDLTGAFFGKLLSMLMHQSRQPSDLYAELAINNPFSAGMMQGFHQAGRPDC